MTVTATNLMTLALIASTYLLFLAMTPVTGLTAPDQAYCDSIYTTMCFGFNHIGCPGVAVNHCNEYTNVQEIVMTSPLIALILNRHNELREKTAKGRVPPFPAAAKMSKIQSWDPELASLARVNAMQCQFGYDQCRSTTNYQFVGQSLAKSTKFGVPINVTQFIESSIEHWFNEYKSATANDIANYTGNISILHFVQMVQYKAVAIGCGGVTYKTGDGQDEYILTCDYSHASIINQPVYVSGPVASGCGTRSAGYPDLCGSL